VVLVTCSPLEVHGPHLPLGADAFEGEGLAERAVSLLPERHRGRSFVKLPFIYAAADPVPQPGSLTFRVSTIIAVLEDLGRSLAAQGFRYVVVSNFHGSPRHFLAIETACERVSKDCGIQMVGLFSLMLTRLEVEGSELDHVLGHLPGVEPEDFKGDTHGGLVETSQLLALHPEWVDPDYKELPRRDVGRWLEEKGEGPRTKPGGAIAALPAILDQFKAGLQYFSQESYSGQPAKASAELGEQILDTLASTAAQATAELLDGSLAAADCRSPAWKLRHVFLNGAAIAVADWILDHPKTVG
ncbi:MAG: creatininase family protein, partial [bacterium]|nr:creatininase family protein [bacterium]